MARWVSVVVVAGLVAFAGCGKSAKPAAKQSTASMDLAKFREAFPTPTPGQQANIDKVMMNIRYRLYDRCVDALAQLSTDTSLTDAQKKAVNDLAEGLKNLMSSTPAPPPQ